MTESTQNEQVDVVSGEVQEETLNLQDAIQQKIENPEPQEALQEVIELDNQPTKEGVEQSDQEGASEDEKILQEIDDAIPFIPKEWNDEERAAFENILNTEDENLAAAAEVLINRYTDARSGLGKKMKEIAEYRKSYEAIEGMLEPLNAQLQAQGVSKQQYIQSVLRDMSLLYSNPANSVKQIIQAFNLKAEDLGFTTDYDYDGVEVESSTKVENNQLTAEQIQNVTQVSQFEFALDSEGKLLHPHFRQVLPIMEGLTRVNPSMSWSDAYHKATISLGLQQPTKEKQQEQEAYKLDRDAERKKVKQAQIAAKAVRSTSTKIDPSKISLRDSLAQRLGGS